MPARNVAALAPAGDRPVAVGAEPGTTHRAARPTLDPDRGASTSAVAWLPSEDMDQRRWIEYGKRIGRAGNGTSWWLGDWLRYGNRRFGERYALAARVTGYDAQTLMNYAYVAAHVSLSHRRADVSWSHHAEVAKLEPPVQAEWLERSAHERLSVKDLRMLLRDGGLATSKSRTGKASAEAGCWVCPHCGHHWERSPETLVGSADDGVDEAYRHTMPTVA